MIGACCFVQAVGAQSKPARPPAAEQAKPFSVDSTYDRFTDQSTIRLTSRSMTASNGLRFLFTSLCKPNGSCDSAAVAHIIYTADLAKADQRKLFAALSESVVCFDFIIYGSEVSRDNACFQLVNRGATKTVGLVHQASELFDYGPAANADSIEGRLSGYGTTPSTPFRIAAQEWRKLGPFAKELTRRNNLGR